MAAPPGPFAPPPPPPQGGATRAEQEQLLYQLLSLSDEQLVMLGPEKYEMVSALKRRLQAPK